MNDSVGSFRQVPDSNAFGFGQNYWWYQDAVSSECDRALARMTRSKGLFVDTKYGRAWSFIPEPGDAVYGKTKHLPEVPCPIGETFGYLRVPYKKIPRVRIRSQEQIREISRAFIKERNEVVTLWRGQRREFPLDRPSSASLILYGDEAALEPSLTPSSARSSIQFEAYMPGWFALVETYLRKRVASLSSTYRSEIGDRAVRQLEVMMRSYGKKRLSFAIAQHYGMPSVGLDLTDDIDVAIFFALHRFERSKSGGLTTVRRISDNEEPVIYVLGAPKSEIVLDELEHPAWARASRPQKQSAFFWSTGWGASVNRAAEYILFAFYPEGHSQWKLKYEVPDLFPDQTQDPFLGHILAMWQKHSWLEETIPLKDLYYI